MKGKIVGMPMEQDSLVTTTTADGVQYSPQQSAVFDWVRNGSGNAFVEAVAGSGKTTTIISACQYMKGSIAFAAFNKKIADEIKGKVEFADNTAYVSRRSDLPDLSKNIRVGTFHSFGFSAWRSFVEKLGGKVRVDESQKTRMMLDACNIPYNMRGAVSHLTSLAKQSAVGILWQTTDESQWINLIEHYDVLMRIENDDRDEKDIVYDLMAHTTKCLSWAKANGQTIIDFDDMIWLPLVENVPFWQYDWILVDEAQDLNDCRRIISRRMMKNNGRAIFVGDRFQAIYGFAGANNDSVDKVVSEFNCTLLPLTVTYRCSKEATKLAQKYVPHIEAHEKNEEGTVVSMGPNEFLRRCVMPKSIHTPVIYDGYSRDDIDMSLAEDSDDKQFICAPGDAILCRLTRPLVSLAFSLIREGIPCYVEGRDIGKQLERLVTKWNVSSVIDLIQAVEQYRMKETEKLIAKNAKYAIEALNDRLDTLLVIAEGCDTVAEISHKIITMFQDTNGGRANTVLLSTIHRAKGREWDRVFILGWDVYMPSKMARKPWEKEQERNLIYVAVTRTKRDLILTGAME